MIIRITLTCGQFVKTSSREVVDISYTAQMFDSRYSLHKRVYNHKTCARYTRVRNLTILTFRASQGRRIHGCGCPNRCQPSLENRGKEIQPQRISSFDRLRVGGDRAFNGSGTSSHYLTEFNLNIGLGSCRIPRYTSSSPT